MDNKVSFAKWDKLFRSQQLSQFNGNAQGLCWLKVKAISRGRLMDKFLNENKISLKATKTGERFIELYDYLVQKDGAEEMLNSFLRKRIGIHVLLQKKLSKGGGLLSFVRLLGLFANSQVIYSCIPPIAY